LIGRSDKNLEVTINSIRKEAERHIPSLEKKTLRSIDICFRPFEMNDEELITVGSNEFSRVAAVNGQEGEGITLAPALAQHTIDLLIQR
jgi:hypothetical protein